MPDDSKYSVENIAEFVRRHIDQAAAAGPKFNRITLKEPYAATLESVPKNALVVKGALSEEAIAELRKPVGVLVAASPPCEDFADDPARRRPAKALNPYAEANRRFGYIRTYLRAKWPEFTWMLDPLDLEDGRTARVTLSVGLTFSGDRNRPRANFSFDVGPEYCLNDGQSEAGECEKACLDMDVANMLREAFADDVTARALRRRIRNHRETCYDNAEVEAPRLSVGFAPLKDVPGTIHVVMDGTGVAPSTNGEHFARAFGQKPAITSEVDVYLARTGRPRLMP